ncbi:MAG: hypothetical protein R3E68_00705 [Burkholderiaceae bacterium]
MPEIGEYERMSTTLANAYVLPIFQRYLGRITAACAAWALTNR